MKQEKELEYYEQIKDWDFSKFEIETEDLTDWDMTKILEEVTDESSVVLDLGTGGGEKVIRSFPEYLKKIVATDFSKEMIETAKKNLKESGRKNIEFKLMDNLNIDLEKEKFDVVVARHTVTDPKQIYEVLKPGGYLIIRGVDKYDCHELKRVFGRGQGYDEKPISIIDYENVLDANFKDVELVPLHQREYFKNRDLLKGFLLKVPIIDDFSKLENDVKDYYKKDLENDKLDEYISKNTFPNGIRLLRRYYGITARK
ncbi:MAG: class I SAM-dependent methyltransferase [Bacilli bacterium]|nr:class I SAM-dependent methyltransferase [Bacilli bacterium]MBR3049193.1 class I SAM-dependent methyltransferase [Bacilli bacterium]